MNDPTIEPAPSGGYILRAECVVPRPIDEVFDFFSAAANLEQITPRWIKFRVVTPPPITMRQGLLLDYKLRIRGLPMRWQSEITAWEPTRRFVDEQRRGPYRFWRHEHLFESVPEGTRVTDVVHYGVPGERLIHWLLVGRDIRNIFRFRQQKLAEIFSNEAPHPAAR